MIVCLCYFRFIKKCDINIRGIAPKWGGKNVLPLYGVGYASRDKHTNTEQPPRT